MKGRRRGISVWFAKPIKLAVLEILEEVGGRISESELRERIKNIYGEASTSIINRVLMSLEIDGLVHVAPVGIKERIIERTEGKAYLVVGED